MKRKTEAGPGLRRKLIANTRRFLQAYSTVVEQHVEQGLPVPPLERLRALEAGEPVTVPGWKLATIAPSMVVRMDRYYVIEADGSLTPSDENDNPRFLQ